MENHPSVTVCHIQPIPCKNTEVYSELNTLIYEYLEVNGLEQALSTFTKECLSKNLPCPKLPIGSRDVKAAFTHYDGDLLLKSFDDGDLDTFLKLWKQFQNHIQVTSEDMKKLEVYLRVHFAIYPKAQNQPEAKQTQAMQLLKTFFEENSTSLSSDATILPLFALPFVADPRPHPIFKDLFHESWTSKLRAQLETTVNKYFELLQENITNHCKLASVVVKNSRTNQVQAGTQMSPTTAAPTPGQSGTRSPARRPSLVKTNTGVGTTPSRQNTTAGGGAGAEGKMSVEGIPQSLLKMTESAILYHQDRFLQLLTIHRKTRKVLKGVRENYSKLLKVSSILITALERSLAASNAGAASIQTSTSGGAAPPPPPSSNLDLILHQCLLIYPEIFTNPSNDVTPATSKPDLAHFKQLAAASSSTTSVASNVIGGGGTSISGGGGPSAPDTSDVSLLFLGLPDISLENLNYTKIKNDLISDKLPATDRLCLLQALRWLITKTNQLLRAMVIDSFVDADLFGVSPKPGESSYSQKLFSCLLSPTPTYQKESLARLINAIASTWTGRTYLTSTNFIINILVRSLTTFKTQEESFICHMVIATLQKLSLRRAMRLFMIDHQVIPWLVKYIKMELERDLIRSEVQSQVLQSKKSDSNSNSNNNNESNYGDNTFNTYLMEYAWALLMNLALHPESIKSAKQVDFEFLHCIVTMLCSRNSLEYFPYVLSTLFSLLRNPDFFDKAKTMDLDKKLGPVIPHQPPEIQRHLRHLLSQLYEKANVDRLTASGETDYDDTDNPDPEDVEPELELQESWMVNQNVSEQVLTGDDLLIREYMLQKDMPLLYVPPGGMSPENKLSSHSQQSLSSQHNSLESSYSKTSRENSTETPPSNQQDKSSGLILRPTTPTHTKSPRISKADNQRASNMTSASGVLSRKRSSISPPSPTPPLSPTILKLKHPNPFLQQFNSMQTSPISHLIPYTDQSSSEHQEELEEEQEMARLLTERYHPQQQDEVEHYERPQTPQNETDSIVTGKFSLHESPLMAFADNNFNLEQEEND